MGAAPDMAGRIAIIGIGCRLPGADDPETFFANLAAGRDAVRHGPSPRPGTVGAFGSIEDVEGFDAAFFRIPPRHAELLAPEQRLLLECAWWALESAGYVPDAAPGAVGVFVAGARPTYRQGPLRHPAEQIVADAAIGQDYAATRISYKLNLRGPSLAVGTASSGSLVAVHLACEALISGQCDMALAGGASVTLPQDGYDYDPALMFAPDGHCRPFDSAAGGAVPGNGGALVLLKPLAAALADGDPVIAVIVAGAVNNDGAGKVDFYAPSQAGQESVIREALAMAGLAPPEIGYVEAHGTGTPLGDPIEVAALDAVFRAGGAAPGSIGLGAVKSNIGHLHTASGVAGLVKAALMLERRTLVPTLHFTGPSPLSVLAGSPFSVETATRPWPAPPGGGPRRAGVSAFWIGGTNAHVVLEEGPERAARAVDPDWALFPVAARTPTALAAAARRLADRIATDPTLALRDVAATLSAGRKHFAHRLCVVARTREGLIAGLGGAGAEGAPADLLAAAAAYVAGGDPPAMPMADARRVALPGYPFERKRHWITQEAPAQATPVPAARVSDAPTDLLPKVREVLARTLGLEPAEVEPDLGFGELGVESITAPLLAVELTAAIGRTVTPEDFYNYPTAARLAAGLAERPAEAAAASTPPPSADKEAVAVIGMAGRFPGAPDLDAFWRLVVEGRSAVGPLPDGLWGTVPTAGRAGGLLPDYDRFDAAFFQVSPREARLMDPQQRVFLEECWRALDDAGLADAALAGSDVGVFAGAQAGDYPSEGDASHGTIGRSLAVLAARVAYALDLRGPALTVDTACSAALAAVHLAVRALQAGECSVALAGGVSISVPFPTGHGFFADAGLLSPGGACRPFAADADGIVPADGVGVVVLKRLADALRDGDTVRGVIRASAMNQDGRTNGITAPNGPAQTALISDLYRRAGIAPSQIGYVEAHGTGTKLGDPIELAALGAAFGEAGCAVGSVKANIGHTLPAAGIAGLLKLLLAMEAGHLPPSPPHMDSGGRVALPGSRFFALGRAEPWPATQPLASVSAFGFGGTNAHVVVAPPPAATAPVAAPGPAPIVLSARDPEALRRRARELGDWSSRNDVAPAEIARALAAAAVLPVRAAFLADDLGELRAGLAAIAAGSAPARIDGAAARFVATGERPLARGPARRRLPPYPFARERFWIDAAVPPAVQPAAPSQPLPSACSGTLAALRRLVAEALMLPEADVLPDSGFATLGMDSILAAELAGRVNAEIGSAIRALDFYDHPTPQALAAAIDGGAPAATPAPAAPAGEWLREVLRAAVADALYTALETVTDTVELHTLGLDSILAVELARNLTERLGRPVRAMDFYDARTVAALADLLAARPSEAVPPEGEPTPVVAAPAEPQPAGADPIAIVGFAGRFPGADDLDAFWDLLREGRDAIREIPPERWPLAGFFDAGRGAPGRSYTRWGGFLDGIDRFDPLFFRISPREAELIDPQERLFLTCAQAAVED
ncbi:MAG: beta-ketoacyl synthase N-terminal-like domain-containing protein, partial [Alphaproteobacteria bacterium]